MFIDGSFLKPIYRFNIIPKNIYQDAKFVKIYNPILVYVEIKGPRWPKVGEFTLLQDLLQQSAMCVTGKSMTYRTKCNVYH
jgi:hypothetical protein